MMKIYKIESVWEEILEFRRSEFMINDHITFCHHKPLAQLDLLHVSNFYVDNQGPYSKNDHPHQ